MASSRLPIGVNVFELDWDLLVVLDSCRIDALRAVACSEEFPFLSPYSISEMMSVGGSTLEWTAATFNERYSDVIEDTALVSANGWPHRILEEGFRPEGRASIRSDAIRWGTVPDRTLGLHRRAWQYGEGRAGWSDQPQADGSVVADLTIDIGRREDFDRVIAHFIEPHYPYAGAARARGASSLNQIEQDPFDYLMAGGEREAVWNAYLTELRMGLRSVSLLLENFDAEKVLITADHGESFGKWGFYGHSSGSFHPHVRRVPLAQTTATDTRTHEPANRVPNEALDVDDHLRSLGYLD